MRGNRYAYSKQNVQKLKFLEGFLEFFCDVFNKSFIFIDLLKARRVSEKTDRVFLQMPCYRKKRKVFP
nr:MAG TPA: hypothetical protein [Caudoviricetes sp.]